MALAVAAVLVLSAVSYEVLSLGASLTGVVKELRVSPLPSALSGRLPARRDSGPRSAPGVAASRTREVSVTFTLSENDLSRLLSRHDDDWLGGVLTLTREVSCRLDKGHVALGTRNSVRLVGLAVGSYPGFSDWSLTPLPGGVGVRLNALRLLGVAVPGASWLVRRFGPSQDGWVVVTTGSRYRVDRIEVEDGKLSVSGTVRGRV